jgi:RNA polymerase sigma-70 factor (ECF subfamily)
MDSGTLTDLWKKRGDFVSFAYNYVRDAVAAEDIIQDAFLKAAGYSGVVDPDKRLGWMKSIIHNRCMDWYRSRGRRRSTCDISVLSALPAPDGSEDGHVTEEIAEKVRTALVTFPARDREIFEKYANGASCRELAAEYNLRESSAYSVIYRVKKALQVQLSSVCPWLAA